MPADFWAGKGRQIKKDSGRNEACLLRAVIVLVPIAAHL
jgi:hypothetical protein